MYGSFPVVNGRLLHLDYICGTKKFVWVHITRTGQKIYCPLQFDSREEAMQAIRTGKVSFRV